MNPSVLMVALPMLLMPACAVLAGGVTWAIVRGTRPEDGTLLRHFLVVLGMLMAGSWGLFSTEAMRERIDPTIREHRAVMAMPVHLAMREHMAYEWSEKWEKPIERAVALGTKAPDVRAQLWPQYVGKVRYLLPFSQPPAQAAYGAAVSGAMAELQASDPALCMRLAWPRAPGEGLALSAALSPAALAALEEAIAGVIATSSQSTSAKASRTKTEAVPQGALRGAYLQVAQPMQDKYGESIIEQLRSGGTGLEPARACQASIELINRSVNQPDGLSDLLVSMLLRT